MSQILRSLSVNRIYAEMAGKLLIVILILALLIG